jgi:hypothetical protein
MENNRLIINVSCLINDVVLYFPDPFVKNLPLDSKDIFIIEHKHTRKKFDKLIIKLEHLLKNNLNVLELKVILKKWQTLNIINFYYIKKFNEKQKKFLLDEEMNAFICLQNIIEDHLYFLQRIQTKIKDKLKY